jgi:hypothetical protein
MTWEKKIKSKRKQLNLKAKQMNWLLGRSSTLSTDGNLLVCEAVLKPTCTHGIELWGQPPRPPIPTTKSFSAFKPRLSNPF